MYDELSAMAAAGHLTPPPHELVRLADYSDALARSMKGFKRGKIIFDMR